MQFSENELEKWIMDASSDDLSDRGFEIDISDHKRFNQIELGLYGRLDIITFGRSYDNIDNQLIVYFQINIIELKIKKITTEDIDQVLRYKTAIREIFKNHRVKFTPSINCFLVGPEMDCGHYIQNYIDSLCIITYKFDLNGLSFDGSSVDGWRRGEGKLTYNAIKKQFKNG